jgi:hypothetical protein
LVDFENRDAIFPGVYYRFKFSLLALVPSAQAASFSFFLANPTQMADDNRRFTLTPSELAAINPNTKTAPVFRSKADAELTKQIYARVPVLIDEAKGKDGNPWGINFQLMFMMNTASAMFRTARQLLADGFTHDGRDWVQPKGKVRYVPLYEAKMIHHYDHRWATYVNDAEKDATRDLTAAEKANHAFDVTPRYWVPEQEVTDRLSAKGWARGWLMGWRDICRAADERTVIASAIPRSGVGNKIPLFFPGSVSSETKRAAALIACLSSLSLDFVARQKIGGTTLNFFYMEQFPILPPSKFGDVDLTFIVPRVIELTYTSRSMKPFAADLGYTGAPFVWDEDRRALLRAELDAKIAKLYDLTRDQLRYILDPTDVYGADYPSETFRVLKNNEVARHGEYRTAKLVLNAWDRLECGELK